MKIRYHNQVHNEIVEATEYYANLSWQLGAQFQVELETAVKLISVNPMQFAEVRPGVRCCLLDRFPYGIYFRMPDAETVRIVVVKHHRRRPGFGMRRK